MLAIKMIIDNSYYNTIPRNLLDNLINKKSAIEELTIIRSLLDINTIISQIKPEGFNIDLDKLIPSLKSLYLKVLENTKLAINTSLSTMDQKQPTKLISLPKYYTEFFSKYISTKCYLCNRIPAISYDL